MAEVVALVIKIPTIPSTITKRSTGYLNVGIDFSYRGPGQTVHCTAVVTQDTWYSEFDEIGSTKKYYDANIPDSPETRLYRATVPNLPLSGVKPKTTPYGVKSIVEGTFGKIEAGNKACLYVAPIEGIELQPGSNIVKWIRGPTSVSVALAEIIDYVQAFYALINGEWVIKGGSWIIPTDQICGISVDRACTVSGFVWVS